MRVKQYHRDLACAALLLAGILVFELQLRSYLLGLDRPFPMMFAFSGSLAAAWFHEIRGGMRRLTFVRLGASTVVFAAAIPVAKIVRDWYVSEVAELVAIPSFRALVGEDYFAALSNHAIGFGSCFAVGLMVVRLAAYARLEAMLLVHLVSPENRPVKCQCCQQLVIL